MKADGANPEPAAPGAPLAGAASQMRESARWLVLTFGAIVAVVFTGIGISDLGALDPDTSPDQFWLALGGAAVALLGAVAALAVSVGLASASTVTVGDLAPLLPEHGVWSQAWTPEMRRVRDVLASDPQLSPWNGDLATLFGETRSAQDQYYLKVREWSISSSPDSARPALTQAHDRLRYYGAIQEHVLAMASYVRLHGRFQRARWTIGVSLTLATVGAAAFVWATGGAAGESVPVSARTATWRVPAAEHSVVATRFGSACVADLDAVPVVILGEQGDGKEYEVVTVPTANCSPVRLVVPAARIDWPTP